MRALTPITILFLVCGVARAEAPPTREAAEQLAHDGRADHDDLKLLACAKAYLDLYDRAPEAADIDEVLYNAGACYEDARSFGGALAAYNLLRKYAPKSKLTGRAILRTARIYGLTGSLDRAADQLETYARANGGEKDAFDALGDATYYRNVLGDDTKRIEDINLMIRMFGAKRPQQAAVAVFGLTEVYQRRGPDEAIKHLRRYLRDYGRDGGDDRIIQADQMLGTLLWTKACPVTPIDGLCQKTERPRVVNKRDVPSRCTTPQTTLTVVKRDATLVKEATAAFDAAQNTFEKTRQGDPVTRHAYAMAKLYRADVDLEPYLALTFPTGLDFSPRGKDASMKRFTAWITQKQQLGGKSSAAYEAVLATKDPGASIAAAARLGKLSQSFATDTLTAELPEDVRSGPLAKDKAEAYCTQMTTVAEPLAARALEAFRMCVQKASELGISDGWSRACERAGAELKPSELTALRELQPDPVILWPVIIEEPASAGPRDPADYAAAITKFGSIERSGWKEPSCRELAAQFSAVARKHPDLVAAPYMAGLSLDRCALATDARRAYESAGDPASLSNLGALEWREGHRDAAQKRWEAALVKNGKLASAHLGLAIASLVRLPAGGDRKLAGDIDLHLANALAVDQGTSTLITAGLRHLDAPALARHYLTEALKVGDTSAALAIARGIQAVRAGDFGFARDRFEEGVAKAPASDEAHLDLALVLIVIHQYAAAKPQLAAVKQPSYEVQIARGIVHRGLGELPEAEAAYHQAIAIDPARATAHFDLGVLDKEYVARATDPVVKKRALAKASEAFRKAAALDSKLGANELADDCDRARAALAP